MLENIVTRWTLHVARGPGPGDVERGTCNALPRGPEPRLDAVHRQAQRRPGFLLPGAMAPQQLDLLPAYLIEHGQAALEAPVELWEPSGEVAGSHETPDHIRGAVILVRHEGEDLGTYPVVREQCGVFAR